MFVAGFLLGDGVTITLGACGLVLVGAGRALAALNVQGLELRLQLPPRFFATRTVPVVVELHNTRGALNARGVDITVRFPHKVGCGGLAACTLVQGSSLLRERISIPARAVCDEVGYELRSNFPLGLFEVRVNASANCPLMVYPRTITPIELQLDGHRMDPNPVAGIGLGDVFGEPRGIRPYQPGDKATRIHQFATAHSISRGRGLQVRSFDPPGFHPEACRIVFHSYAKAGEVIRLDRFERALSLLSGTLAHYQTSQTKVSFQADFDDWRVRRCQSRTQYFEALALITHARRCRKTTAGDLVEVLQKLPADEQLIILSDATPDHWAELLGPMHRRAILVDIRQVRFKQRTLHTQLSYDW